MKRVILLRHGKSSWRDPELEDHDRPLNKRGRGSSIVIGGWLSCRGYQPDVVLCSSAIRTRETAKRVRRAMPELPEPVIEPRLYLADPDGMVSCLRQLPEDAETVLLVGHQPGLSGFARKLANQDVRPRCAQAFAHFPTAAAAVLELDISKWNELAYGLGRFVDFAKPRELDPSL